jgi:sorbitol-specific phosphotransferase system component IIA
MNTENFISNGLLHWFTGVIEDINDPQEMGRVRVRCFGYHNSDKIAGQGIPTEDLPWAHVMMPVTSASMTEIGQSATGLLQGSWVIGFFRDGSNAQDPLVIGSIPSMSSTVDYQLGFTDPDERYPVQSKLDIAETPLAAKSLEEAYKNAFSYTKKKELRDTHDSVPTANAAHNNNWKFPDIDSVIAPQYPKNHVIAYEKADDAKEDSHIVEFDVTPGQERISTIHRTGTYHEITPTGDETTTIVGNEFKIVVKDQNVNVIGNCNLTVDSNCSTYIKGNWNIQVDGNVIENIGGSLTQNVTGDVKETYTSNQKTAVSGNIDIDGARIDLN